MLFRYFYLPAALLLLCAVTAHAQDNKANDTTHKEQKLKEVVITTRKDAIETAPGKTIINVQEQAGNAGKNVLELLRKIPGVSVDGMGNINITGKQGVMVLVDGRPTYLEGDDLRDYLQGMTAEEVAQIELITQPSAQYDASGNAGIINIKTRKLRGRGFNGNATLAATKSLLSSTHNTLLLNYRKNKTNWYASINNNTGKNTVFWQQAMRFKDTAGNDVATSSLKSVPVEAFDKYNIRTGADCRYSEQTTMGYSLSGAYNTNQMLSPITTQTSVVNSPPTTSIRNTYLHFLRKNAGANLYLKHNFNKQSEINFNLDYLLNTNRRYQYLHTEAYSANTPSSLQLILRSSIPIKISVYSATTDYTTTLTNGLKIETGAKHSYVAVDNAAHFMQYTGGNWVEDSGRTNKFLYTEHISALYLNGVKKINNKWDVQLGLRFELANLQGMQEATGERLSRHLPALFPTAYVSYKPDSTQGFEINYGRRVERPQYGMLNPFNYYTFYSTYQRGNTALLPQYTHDLELKHTYKNHLTTAIDLNAVTNSITYVNKIEPATQVAYGMPINFKTDRRASLSITYNGNPRPWWELMISASAQYATYNGLLNNIAIQNEGAGYSAWMNNSITLGKWGAGSYLSYTSGMATSPISIAISTFYSNIGISRKLMQDKLTLKMTLDDPFYLYRNGGKDTQPGFYNDYLLRSNSRYLTLVVTYKFGKKNEIKTEQNNKTPDEAKRL